MTTIKTRVFHSKTDKRQASVLPDIDEPGKWIVPFVDEIGRTDEWHVAGPFDSQAKATKFAREYTTAKL